MTVSFIVFSAAGCGANRFIIKQESLEAVNQQLDLLEKSVENQGKKIDLIAEKNIRHQEILLESMEQNVCFFEGIKDQIQQINEEFARRIKNLENAAGRIQPDNADIKSLQRPFPQTAGMEKLLVGRIEKVRLMPPGQIFHARIDTGATTSSLDARDIETFERDGSSWVRFKIKDPDKDDLYEVEKPVVRKARIIQASASEATRRPVIELQFQIGKIKRIEEFTLEDRAHLDYQVLIGRNILQDLMIVDVASKFIAPLQEEKNGTIK
jgi:hypothetical protein